MSDHDEAAWPPRAPDAAAGPVIEHPADPAPARERIVRRGGTPLALTLLLTAALGGGIYYAWAYSKDGAPAPAADPAQARAEIVARTHADAEAAIRPLADQLQSLGGRVDALEKRPTPAPAGPGTEAAGDLASRVSDLSAKVDALQKASEQTSPSPAPAAAAPDTAAAQASALAAQQQLADLAHKVEDAAAKQSQAEQALAQQKAADDALEQRLRKLEAGAQVDTPEARQGAADDAKRSAEQVAALDARVGRLEQGAGAVQGAARTAGRAVRIEAAEAALASGQPLGDLPGASPALARYAKAAPPTDADLRARFPAVADAAAAASQPDLAHRSFVDRMLARVQQSVIVRRGDRVIVGDPASGVLARAREAVDRDDLKAAADALDGLTGQARDAAAAWVGQVRQLLAARAALAEMARG